MSETKKSAAIATLISIVCGLFCMSVVSLRESRSERLAADACSLANDAIDKARIGTWHLMVAATGPHVGMPVTLHSTEGSERPGLLLSKVANKGWMIAVFDGDRAEWAVIGPMLEGTREEIGTWTPAICGGMRPGFSGVGHDHGSDHVGWTGSEGIDPHYDR